MKGRNLLRDVVVDGRIILKLMLNKLRDRGILFDLFCYGLGQVLGGCAHGSKTSCSIKCGLFVDGQFRCWLLHKHCAACSLLFAVRFSETRGV